MGKNNFEVDLTSVFHSFLTKFHPEERKAIQEKMKDAIRDNREKITPASEMAITHALLDAESIFTQ